MFERLLTGYFTSNLIKFSGRHQGDTCYIFGDGPSIKWFDLACFSDHPAIYCGTLQMHKDFYKLNVKYATIAEPWAFAPKWIQPEYLHDLRPVLEQFFKKTVEQSKNIDFFINLSNRLFCKGKNVHYMFRGFPTIRNETDRLLNQFDLFAGSFHASLSLAYYLGFTKIYLVGFDGCTVQPTRTSRWYELGEGDFVEATDFAIDFLSVLKRECDIYTISAEGSSCNVNYINYTDYTGKEPVFRENHELISEKNLRLLSSNFNNIFPKKI